MPRRAEVPELENRMKYGGKKFVRYEEGAKSMKHRNRRYCLHFQGERMFTYKIFAKSRFNEHLFANIRLPV